MHEDNQSTTYEYWRTVIPNDTELKKTVMKELHCVPYAGHPGFARTLEVIRTSFYWKHMTQDVRAFVVDCPVCQTEKSSHLQPAGRLMPLALPTRKWEHVAIDFVTGMPDDAGMNAIMTVVDKATKMTHFIPCMIRLQPRARPSCIGSMLESCTASQRSLYPTGMPALRVDTGASFGVFWAPIFGWGPGSILNHQVRWNASTSYWSRRCAAPYISTAKLDAGRRYCLLLNLQSTTRQTELRDTLPSTSITDTIR